MEFDIKVMVLLQFRQNVVDDEVVKSFNPIPGVLWNYVVRRGGAIMARTFKRCQKLAKIPSSAPKLDLR